MELTAAYLGLQAISTSAIGKGGFIYTDSPHVMNYMVKWLGIWESKGWVTKRKRPVQHADMLRHMAAIMKQCSVKFVRLPTEHLGIEEAAKLASEAADNGIRSGCHIRRGSFVI
jgi:ribonuclease HI